MQNTVSGRRLALAMSLVVSIPVLAILLYSAVTGNIQGWTALTYIGTKYVTVFTCLFLFLVDPELGLTAYSAVLLAGCAAAALKLLFKLPRPPPSLWRVKVSGYGFPSGHATMSSAAYGLVALSFRYPCIITTCCLLVLAVALSRVMLGVHYPRDVIGGAVIGFSISLAMYLMYRRLRTPLVPLVLFIVLGTVAYVYCRYPDCLNAVALGIGLTFMHIILRGKYDKIRRSSLIRKGLSAVLTLFLCLAVVYVIHGSSLVLSALGHVVCGMILIGCPYAVSAPQLHHH